MASVGGIGQTSFLLHYRERGVLMPDLVIDGITIRSKVYNVATGETKPFDECKEEFFRHYLKQSKIVPASEEQQKRKPNPDADWYVVLNKEKTGIDKVLKKGDEEYERIRKQLIGNLA